MFQSFDSKLGLVAHEKLKRELIRTKLFLMYSFINI
jgi:hypothetical protein